MCFYVSTLTFASSCGGTCESVTPGREWLLRSGQKPLLTILTDKPSAVQFRHTPHMLCHHVSFPFIRRPLKRYFNTIPPSLNPLLVCLCVCLCASVPPNLQQPAVCIDYMKCAGVGVRMCATGTRCRYETPYWVIAWPSCFTAVCLNDP